MTDQLKKVTLNNENNKNVYEIEFVLCNTTVNHNNNKYLEDNLTTKNNCNNEIITDTNSNIEEDNIIENTEYATKYELYHCNTCNIDFENVNQHVKKFHKNQSVLLDEVNFQNTDDKDNIIDRTHDAITTTSSSYKNEPNIVLDNNSINNKLNLTVTENTIQQDADVQSTSLLLENCENCNDEMTTNHFYDKSDIITEQNPVMKIGSTTVTKISNPIIHELNCYNCNCTYVFKTQSDLQNHINLCNNINETKKKLINNSTNKPLPEEKISYSIYDSKTCEICNTEFASIKSLKLHRRMHEPVELKSYKEALGYKYKKQFKNIQYFNCEICKKRFDIQLEEVHRKFHQNSKTLNEFICHICNKKFMNQISFSIHLKLHENQIDKPKKKTKAEEAGITLPYVCQYCGRGFSRPHEKVKHERIHTGEKPFKCEVCGKAFRVSYSLTLHLRTHTAARPYACSFCNKRFKSYSVYSHHLLTHSDNRPYQCPHCPKTFKTSVQLHGHKNSHTKPFHCPECNRPFATMYAVKTHMDTHKKETSNMKQHCQVCGASYARVFALKDHMREVHNIIDDDDITKEMITTNDSNIIYIINEIIDDSIIKEEEEEEEIIIETSNNIQESNTNDGCHMDWLE